MQQQGVTKFTAKALKEINNVYEEEAGTSFREATVRDKTIKKKSKYENRKEKRRYKNSSKCEQTVHRKGYYLLSFLAEGESKLKYH